MKFVKIGNVYYNTALIGWVMSKEDEQNIIHYFVQFIGGSSQEITEEEFNNIIA